MSKSRPQKSVFSWIITFFVVFGVFVIMGGTSFVVAAADKDSLKPMKIFLHAPFNGKKAYCRTYDKVSGEYNETPLGEGGTCDPEKGQVLVQEIYSGDAGNQTGVFNAILKSYVAPFFQFLVGIVAGISVLMVIVGGIQIMMAGGDSGGSGEGKERIQQALIGLVLVILSSLILYTVNPNFFVFVS